MPHSSTTLESSCLRTKPFALLLSIGTWRCASDLTDYIASDPSVSNFLGTLFGLLGRGGAKNMHQRVMGTFANLAYLCVAGGASTEWAGHLRYQGRLSSQ